MSNNPLTRGEVDVAGDKAAGFGVIIPALEIIPARFGIVDISTVTERLILP